MEKQPFPILEFDPTREAVIEPADYVRAIDAPEHCVITFFQEVVEKVVAEHKARIIATFPWEDGPHHVYEIEHKGRRLALVHPDVGAPVAAAILEDVIALGCRKFIVCGGCGVIEKGIAVGHLIVVSAAVRDEGTSYHYMPAGRELQADARGVAALESALKAGGLPYLVGKTWTTDAPYRETRDKVELRRSEGCLTVEMEASALMAVAQFRKVVLGQVLYGGDDLSGDEWDHRDWQSRSEVRERLFWLAAAACLRL
jgi:uridine phosphorylase